MKRFICLFLFSLTSISFPAFTEVKEIQSIVDLKNYVDEDTLLVTDLNHVIIRTEEDFGSDFWVSREVKHRMENEGKSKKEVLDEIVPLWHHILMEAGCSPVEPTTVSTYCDIQNNGTRIVGLTAQYTEMAYVTINKLNRIGIDLKMSSLNNSNYEVFGGRAAKFIEGIIFVGLDNDKGETLFRACEQAGYLPKKITFIDDKEKNVRSLEKACEKRGIPFTGLRYTHLDEEDKAFNAENSMKAFDKRYQEWNASFVR